MSNAVTATVRLREAQREALAQHFLALDPEDRRLRFGAAISDEGVRQYVARIDISRDCVFAVHDEELRIVAAVHVAVSGGTAELGLSVNVGWRGKGHGHTLLTRAVTWLRNRGISSVYVHCLAENAAMMHLARKSGMRLAYSGSESDGHLELEPATPLSIMDEWVEDRRGSLVQAVRHQNRLARVLFGAAG